MKKGQKANKIPKLDTKVGKYFMAVKRGKTKKEAQIIAGYAMSNKSQQIEKSSEFQALQTKFGTDLQTHITIHEINGYLADNIRQDGAIRVDRNARNRAIEIAKDMIEPDGGSKGDEDGDKVLIVLSK